MHLKTQKVLVIKKAKSFEKAIKIENRMECYLNQHAYITLKDHKGNHKTTHKSD